MLTDDSIPFLYQFKNCLTSSIHRKSPEAIACLFRTDFDRWRDHRRCNLRYLREISAEYETFHRNCLKTTIAGSSIGIVSSGVAVVGLVVFPPLAISASIVGAAAGFTSVTGQIIKIKKRNQTIEKIQKYIEIDRELFQRLYESFCDFSVLIETSKNQQNLQDSDKELMSFCDVSNIENQETFPKAEEFRDKLVQVHQGITRSMQISDVQNFEASSVLVEAINTLIETLEHGLKEIESQILSSFFSKKKCFENDNLSV